ncbi:MAG: lipopolysaccharide biosynthesis protein [Gammaproteobacteria bacterium]
MKNLGSKIALGAIWMVVMRMSIRFIGLISTLILLRLLAPADFGLMALVMSTVATIELLRAFGFELALIQDQDAGPDEYNTVWTMEILMAAGTGLLLILIARWAGAYYDDPRLTQLLYIIAGINFLHGFRNIGIVDFRKQLQFDKEFRYNVSIKVVAFVATITSAWFLRSYWALMIGISVGKLSGLVLSYTMHEYRPSFSLRSLRKLFRFSRWIFFNNMGIVARLRGPDFIIGKMAGTQGLGLYTVAYEISNLATTELIAPINRALLPGFAKIAHDAERARAAFVKAASVMALFSLPVALGIAATAPLIGTVVLGEKWLGAVPLIELLAVAGVVTAIASPITSCLIALGKPHVVAGLSLFNAVVLLSAVTYMSTLDGVQGAALGVLLVAGIFLPIYFAVAMKFLHLRAADMFTILLRPALAAAIMYFVVRQILHLTSSDVLNIVLAASIGALIFVSIVFLSWRLMPRRGDSAEAFILDRVQSRLPQRLRKKHQAR